MEEFIIKFITGNMNGDSGDSWENPKLMYEPENKSNNLDLFQKFVEERCGLTFANYFELHSWSVKNYPEFWDCLWHYFKIIHSVKYSEVFDKSRSFDNMVWFHGARLNYAENVFRYRDSRLALITINEENQEDRVTYKQMYEETSRYQAALKSIGIKIGDRVTCYMSNRKEAIFAFFATTSIGAIWSGCLPYFGVEPVVDRLSQIEPKVLFTMDRFIADGKEIDMLSKVREIEKSLPSLEKIIVLPTKQDNLDLAPSVPKSVWLSEFLSSGSSAKKMTFEQLPFDHTLSINYTSGTTGKPKALMHSIGSFLSAMRDFGLHQNCTRDDILLSLSPSGWISWNLFVNSLHIGGTLCLYEGSPYLLSPTAFWDIVERFNITYIFIPTSFLEDFRKLSYLPTKDHHFKNLRLIGGSCSPVKPQIYDFVQESIIKPTNPDVKFLSMYGCTEAMGFISGNSFNLPFYRGEHQCFVLGVDAKCIDSQGNYAIGQRGDLVIANPLPTFPTRLFRDSIDKLRESYLMQYPGHWSLNDECWINPKTKGFVIFGRSDETMKSQGERFNSSDIYSVVDHIKEIEDCLCVSQTNEKFDERVILFVKLASNISLTTELEHKIKNDIENALTEDHVPHLIIQAPEIPYNFSGKKMELLVKKLICKKAVLNKEVLRNPSSISFYADIPALRNF